MEKEKIFNLYTSLKESYFTKNHTQNSIVWLAEIKTRLNSQTPSTWQPKAWKKWEVLQHAWRPPYFFVFNTHTCWSQNFRVNENVQHNDLIVLSRKMLVSWRVCIAMVEDTMGIDTIMQRELTKWEEILPATTGSR